MTSRRLAIWSCSLASLAACERGASTPADVEAPSAAASDANANPAASSDAAGPGEVSEAPPDPGPPVTLTPVAQHGIGPATQWRFDPDGRLVAWENEGRCGLWSYDSGDFYGYFDNPADGPCQTWPGGLTRYAQTSAEGPIGAATVDQDRVRVTLGQHKTLDESCGGCKRYEAVAWSPDGTQLAVARSRPWGVDVWAVAEAKKLYGVDLDAEGKEQDIGVLWGTHGLFAFVSHAYDPNEGKYGREDFGMEDFVYVHGPALSWFRITPNGASAGRELRSVSDALKQIVIDPRLGAAWVQLRSEDPREFGNTQWMHVPLGAKPGIGGAREFHDYDRLTGGGMFWGGRWVERPHAIFETYGSFTRVVEGSEQRRYVVLGIAGLGSRAAWFHEAIAHASPATPTLDLREPRLDGVGVDWFELRGRICPDDAPDDDPRCDRIGREHSCELVDYSPDGERTIRWCPPNVALFERDGGKVVDLIALDPAELRWRWLDGETFALLGKDRNLVLVDVAAGKVRETIPDVRQIYPLEAGADFGLFAYRTGDGFVLRSVDGQRRFERGDSVFTAAIDPTGARVAVGDLKKIDVYEIATGTKLASWKAGKIREIGYRQDGAILFGTQVRERGPTRAWDPNTGAEQPDAVPSAEFARALADDPSWRWAWVGMGRLRRALDGRTLAFDHGGVMLDNGLYEGEPPRALAGVVLRRGDTLADFAVYDALDLAPALRREGLFAAFMAGEPLPEVTVGEHELERLIAAEPAAKLDVDGL